MTQSTPMPWAYATKAGWKAGLPTGNYFRYFATEQEANHSLAVRERHWPNKWHGPIEYRPCECNALGAAL